MEPSPFEIAATSLTQAVLAISRKGVDTATPVTGFSRLLLVEALQRLCINTNRNWSLFRLAHPSILETLEVLYGVLTGSHREVL